MSKSTDTITRRDGKRGETPRRAVLNRKAARRAKYAIQGRTS